MQYGEADPRVGLCHCRSEGLRSFATHRPAGPGRFIQETATEKGNGTGANGVAPLHEQPRQRHPARPVLLVGRRLVYTDCARPATSAREREGNARR